ncbi:RNA 3'-terminal phosphate cyclase [Candidatus Woesearchaeota archaeon]|nr:RNA 3'-terminal phosphate cyclase [Candidatus Woesearchaeota archaeon]
MDELVKLDGSHNEGGGQILRTALALSIFTQKPFTIDKIRQNRSQPGLKAQHLHCIKALLELTNNKAKAIGAELGSTKLDFFPAEIVKSKLDIDIGTAGSITLVLQSLLPCLVLRSKRTHLTIIGGTDTKWSPLFDYLKEVIIPQFSRYAKIELNLLKRGFYPKGNGKVEVKIKPYKLEKFPEINLIEQGELVHISGRSFASKELMNAKVAERQADSAKKYLSEKLNGNLINISAEYNDTLSIGTCITLWAIFKDNADNIIRLGSDGLGEKGVSSEEVGKEVAKKLVNEINSKAPVDVHLADNLIPVLGIVGGKIKVSEISNHTLTNIYTTELFLKKKFNVDKENKIISVI